MGKTLVIMAAGLGSRFGGVKQIERVGPEGEILLEYSVYDALRCGFDSAVLIIKPDMLNDVKALCGDRMEESGVKLSYAFQDMCAPGLPDARTKPLGTVHAMLSARKFIRGPFAVLNADDFYGRSSFEIISAALDSVNEPCDCAMAAYSLKNTISPYGSVTRGICRAEDGFLKEIREVFKISLCSDGAIRDLSDGNNTVLLPDSPVSMNMWAFHPSVMDMLEEYFQDFLAKLEPGDNKSECLLPVAVGSLMDEGRLKPRLIPTPEHWFGLTYREDAPPAAEKLRCLHASGEYPAALWK